MTDIEIPKESERKGHYRFFEILPGFTSWSLLFVPFIVGYFNVRLAAFLVLAYLLVNFVRAMAGAFRALHGYSTMRSHQKLPWTAMIEELADGKVAANAHRPEWHRKVIARLDWVGGIILVLYIVIAIFRAKLVGVVVHGPQVAPAGLAVVAGTMAGRVIGMRTQIRKVLKAQGIF